MDKLPYMQQIRAIIFDMDGTVRHSRPSYNQTFLDVAVTMGATDSIENRQRTLRWAHYYWAQSPELLDDLGAYKSLTPEFWSVYSCRTLEKFGCSPELAARLGPQVEQHMSENFEAEDWVPEEVPHTLQMLKEAGFSLGLLSNRGDPVHEQLDGLGLGHYFHMILAAGEVNAWKPDPAIFHHALQRMNVMAEQALYVGDNYYADIVGAQRAGLHSVLLDPEHLFPDADCPVIQSISDLLALVEQSQPQAGSRQRPR